MVEAALKFVAVPDPDGPVIYRQMSEMSCTGTAAIGAKRPVGGMSAPGGKRSIDRLIGKREQRPPDDISI
jgi:hypothetical protein